MPSALNRMDSRIGVTVSMQSDILGAILALFLVSTLVAPYIGGAPGAYVVIVLSLTLAAWYIARPSRQSFEPGAATLLASFAILGIDFALTGRPGSGDVLFAGNFAMFALFTPISGALNRFAGPRSSSVVAWLALAGSLVAALVAVVQVGIYRIARAEGFGSNPIASSTVAMLLGFFALMGAFAVNDWRRYIFLLGPIAGVATVFLGGSRGPLLALPGLLIIALVMVPLRRVAIVAGLALCVVAAGIFVLHPSTFDRIALLPKMLTELATGRDVDADESGSIRYELLQGSIAAFLESPWLGHGWAMKAPAVRDLMTVDVGINHPTKSHLHSDILDFAVSGGIVGLFAYLLALLAPIVGAAASKRDGQYRPRLYATLILSVGFACCGAVNLLFGFEFLTTFYVACAAIFLGFCRDDATHAM